MRTTPSRFSTFIASVDPNVEGRPIAPETTNKPASAESVLELRYPRTVHTLTLLWGYPELNQYFDKISTGGEAHLQLDTAAMAEIMLLAAIHSRICPQRPTQAIDHVYGSGRLSGPWRPARPRG
jgi:hypothetical protein